MGRRRIEMFQYRQVLVRLRAGDSERLIARDRLMGRGKAAAFRALAARHGWLDADAGLPSDEQIAAAVGLARRARTTVSSAEPWRELVAGWIDQGVGMGIGISRALHLTGPPRSTGGFAVEAGRRAA